MPAIEWTAAMETGVAEMDHQHRFLVDILNEALERPSLAEQDGLFDRITKDLLHYALVHFDTEEGLMRQYAYDSHDPAAAEQHRHAHRSFSERVAGARAGGDDPEARGTLLEFLRDWLTSHVLETDRELAAHVLRARQPRP
jgi:hemerythrin-like metal-binding protein